MKYFQEFLSEFYYLILVPFLSISVFFVSQYLTRGVGYFVGKNGIKWGFLGFMAVLQFFVSVMVTWSVLSAFSSDFLSEYETMKMTAIIIIGGAPFNITILIWVALKLETYKLMRARYGDDFKDEEFLKKVEKIEEEENKVIKENLNKEGKDVSPLLKKPRLARQDKEAIKHDKEGSHAKVKP